MGTDVTLAGSALRRAAQEGADGLLELLAGTLLAAAGGVLTAESMPKLSAAQHTLLAYRLFRDEMAEGGFVQLIQNGYGPYVFHNPFAAVLRTWGLDDLAALVNRARRVYEAHRAELERERSDEEFMALYEQFPQFEAPEEEFIEGEEDFTARVAAYAEGHLDEFVRVVPDNNE